MKYSYGVPAWMGGIKVSLILFGIPAIVAALITASIDHWIGLSRGAFFAVYTGIFLLGISVLLLLMALKNRHTIRGKKPEIHDSKISN